MVDRIRNASVLGYALVGEIYLAILVYCYVLKESVACDGTVNIRFRFLVEVDYFRIATAFEIEYTLVVPAVFVVTNKLTLRVGRQCGLARTRKTEEDCCVLAVHIGIC